MNVIRNTLGIIVLSAVFLIVVKSGNASDDNDPLQAQAIQLIIETADKICVNVKNEGTSSLTEYSGEASAELSKVLKSLADLGIKGAAKYQESEYQGPLREDLVEAIKVSQDCKLTVFKSLEAKLILPRTAQNSDESEEKEKARQAVLDPYNNGWKCEITIAKHTGQHIAAGELVFGKVTKEPAMSYARVRFDSRRTRRLAQEITFDSGAWSMGYFGECLDGECMSFISKTEPHVPVFLVNKVFFDEEAGRIDISGVVMTRESGGHSSLGTLTGVCKPK